MKDLLKGDQVGEGGYGTVYFIRNSKKPRVVKEIRFLSAAHIRSFQNEKLVIQQVKASSGHQQLKRIAKFYSFTHDDEHGSITMKYYKQDLLDVVTNSERPLSEGTLQRIFYRICKGVQFLHKNGIAHLDLKPENILMKHHHPYLTDFGNSQVCRDQLVHFVGGTSYYRPPEAQEGNCNQIEPYSVDIFSLGIILHICLTGCFPYNDNKVLDLAYAFHILPPDVCRLIAHMVDSNPINRPTINQVLDHPWVKQARYPRVIKSVMEQANLARNKL